MPSARTVKDIRGVLRSALNHAATEELVTRNAAALVKLPPVRRRRGRAWTSDEARRFLESARADRDPFYAAYVLILVLGLRKGEVLGLTGDAVDLAAGELSIGWQLQRVGGQLLHRETKTQTSDATLPLPDICAAALDLRQQARKADRDAGGHRLAGLAAAVHHPLRNPGRAAQLQPFLGRPLRPGRSPEDHRARRPAYLRARCSSTWTCTRASSCRCSGTPRCR